MNDGKFAFLFILIVLFGCDAGGSGKDNFIGAASRSSAPISSSEVHFEGNWLGTITPDLSSTTFTAIALVNGWGEFRLVTENAQFVGWPHRTATSIEGIVTGIRAPGFTWHDGTHSNIFTLTGDFSEGDFINARYEGRGERGSIALASVAEAESRIGTLVGTWVQYDEQRNISATIQIDSHDTLAANIHGSHVNGCQYIGETEAWTSRYSYDVVPFEVSGCPSSGGLDPNGTYSGTAALVDLLDDSLEESVLVMALSEGLQQQITFFLHKISE